MRTYSRKKVEYQMIERVKELCRLCLEKCDESVPIFTDNSDVCAALSMRIMICVGLEISREDSLPNMICKNCYSELERYYSFRKKCEATYQKLKAHILAMKEREANKLKVEIKEDSQDSVVEDNMEVHLPNGDGQGQLVLALNENKQLQLVNIVSLNGVLKLCEKGDQPGSQVLQQCEESQIQNQVDISSNQQLQQSIDQIQHHGTLSSNSVLQQNIENVIQMQDVSTTSQVRLAASPGAADMSQLIASILVRLGVLGRRGAALELADPDFGELELEGRDGETMVMELLEEDDDMLEISVPPVVEIPPPQEADVSQNPVMKMMAVEAPMAAEFIQTKTRKPKKRQARADQNVQHETDPVRPAAGAWCATCGKVFSTRSVLARHRRTHSAERPYECGACGRRFTQRAVLTRHELVHSADRPFKCTLCPKSFTQRAALAAHARSHAPPHARALALHLCGSCPKVFLHPSGLSRHMSVHDGRVFACDDCGKQFTDKSALQRHLRVSGKHGKGA